MFKKKKVEKNQKPSKKKEKKNKGKQIENILWFREFDKTGICELEKNYYSMTFYIEGVNYRLLSEDGKIEIFYRYCEFLNSFDNKIQLQITLQKKKRTLSEVQNILNYPHYEDDWNCYREEMNDLVNEKASDPNNGYEVKSYLTFVQYFENEEEAQRGFKTLEERLSQFIRRIGGRTNQLNRSERLAVCRNMLTNNCETDKGSGNYQTKKDILPNEVRMKESKEYLRLDELYAKSYYFAKYPAELTDEVLSEFLDLPKEFNVNLFIQPINQDDAFDLVKTKLAFMEQHKVDEQKKALKSGYDYEMLPYDLSYSLDEAKDLLNELQNKSQKLFNVTGSVYYLSETKEQMNEVGNLFINTARRYGLQLTPLFYLQEAGLNATLPIGNSKLPYERSLTTASTAIFLPFPALDMMQKNGLYYGINDISKNIISMNRKFLKAPNGFVLGTPGSGKSFAVKREVVNVLLKNPKDEVIIIDPEREYQQLCENFAGEQVIISNDAKTYINPLDLIADGNNEFDMGQILFKAEFIISLCDLIVGGVMGLSSVQKSIIDRNVRKTYEIFRTKNEMPTLYDFYEVLKEESEEEAHRLVLELELYMEGSLSLFSHKTNVNTDNRLVVYDIKDLGRQMKTLGMLVVLDQVWNKICLNREKGIRTWVYIDEMQLLFTNDYASNYFFELWSRARKWGAIPTGITQNVETLLLSDLARRMLSNSEFVMLLNQAKSDRSQVVRLFDISEDQEKYLVNSPEGCGLLIFGENVFPFVDRFPKETKLYQMMTTKPEE